MLNRLKVSVAVLLCSLLAVPQVAFATSEGDQTMLSQEELEAAIQSSPSVASEENAVAAITSSSTYTASGSAKMVRLGGADRYETAAAEARHAFPSGCTDAIVVGSSAWADALTAASLAGAMDCPILFAANYVPASTASALRDLGVSNILLVGGPGSISMAAEQELASIVGQTSLVRLYGTNRYETQEAVFEYGQSKGLWTHDLLIIASGIDFPDALSASSLAFAKKAPVVLLDATAYFPDAQLSSLNQVLASSVRYKQVAVLGGTGVSSAKALSYANSLTVSGSAAIRLGGGDRYETSVSIAQWCVSQGYLGWDRAAFASASLPYDALAGSVVQGKDKSVLLLLDDRATQNNTVSLLGANRNAVNSLKLFGGKGSISGITSLNIAKAVGMSYRDLPGGFRVYVDAGHGQNSSNNGVFDPGAISGSYVEANLTSDLANRIAISLRNKGVDAYVNTGGWYKLRHPQAIANGYDAFISIHFNAGGGSGTESYIHSYNASPFSARWQSLIHPKLVSVMGLKDRGQKRAELAVCGGRLPSVLLEICYIDNGADMSRYLSRRDVIANAIAEGAVQW